MVVLIVMGCALLLLGAFVFFCRQHDMAPSVVQAMSMDVEPTSGAVVLLIGAAMVVLGAYPMVSPWQEAPAPLVATTGDGAPAPVVVVPAGGFSPRVLDPADAAVDELGGPQPGR